MTDILSSRQRAAKISTEGAKDHAFGKSLVWMRWGQGIAAFAIGFLAVTVAALIIWPLLPVRYEAPATIVLLVGARDDDPNAIVKQMRQTPDENETQSDIDLISSPELAARVVADNHLESDPEFNGSNSWSIWLSSFPIISRFVVAPRSSAPERIARRNLTRHLKVARDRKSYTVTFGYWSNDPVKAAVLTQSLLAAYMELQPNLKKAAIERTTAWLNDRVERLRVHAAAADKRVTDLMDTSGLMDRGAETSLQSQLTTLSSEYAAVEARGIDDRVKADALKTMQSQGLLEDAPEVLASSAIQRLKESRALSSSHPGSLLSETAATTSQIRMESNHIVAAVVAQADADQKRLVLIGRALAEVRNAIKLRAEAQVRLDVLQRDAKASHTVLEESLVRLHGQTSLAMTVAPDIEVMARPEQPFQAAFPNRMLAALGTFAVAIICGLALALRRHFKIELPLPRVIRTEPNLV